MCNMYVVQHVCICVLQKREEFAWNQWSMQVISAAVKIYSMHNKLTCSINLNLSSLPLTEVPWARQVFPGLLNAAHGSNLPWYQCLPSPYDSPLHTSSHDYQYGCDDSGEHLLERRTCKSSPHKRVEDLASGARRLDCDSWHAQARRTAVSDAG